MLESEIVEERATKEEDDSDDDMNIQEIKKRDMKSHMKPQIGGLAFKRPAIKITKREDIQKRAEIVNPLALLGGIDSDDD